MNDTVIYIALLGACLLALMTGLLLRHLKHANNDLDIEKDTGFMATSEHSWVRETLLLYLLAVLIVAGLQWGVSPPQSAGDLVLGVVASGVITVVLLPILASAVWGWRTGRSVGAHVENSVLTKIVCFTSCLLALLFAPVGVLVLVGASYPRFDGSTATGYITVCCALWLAAGLASYSRGSA